MRVQEQQSQDYHHERNPEHQALPGLGHVSYLLCFMTGQAPDRHNDSESRAMSVRHDELSTTGECVGSTLVSTPTKSHDKNNNTLSTSPPLGPEPHRHTTTSNVTPPTCPRYHPSLWLDLARDQCITRHLHAP